MKKLFSVMLVLLLTASLAACASDNGDGNGDGDNGDDGSTDIILITDVGTIDDGSFNEGAFDGVREYGEENDVTYEYYRPANADDEAYYDEISKAINDGGAKVIVTPGHLFEVAVHRAQNDFPDTKFILLDGAPRENQDADDDIADNTYSVIYEEHQAGFLAGYAAVHEGFTKLGYIGGMKVPAVERFGIGYVDGADVAAAELGVDVEMRFHYANTFEPSEEVASLASGWYAGGTEVIFAAAGGAGNSVFKAAEDSGAKTIGVDVDQYDASETVVTSATKQLAVSVYDALEAFYNDEFPGGTQFIYGVEDNGVGISDKFDRFENFTESDYEEIYEKLKADEDGILSDIPRTHEADFSDRSFDHVDVTVVQ